MAGVPSLGGNLTAARMAALRVARQRLGMSRLEIGALLELIRDDQSWKGYARTFGEFLEDLRIHDSAAYQWMRIARKFIGELGLRDNDLASLALVNMRILDQASRVINRHNMEEVLGTITELHERDARETLAQYEEIEPRSTSMNARVRKVYDALLDLPDDLRSEFYRAVEGRKTGIRRSVAIRGDRHGD